MRKLLSELNNFSEATTVHGFAYLSKGQSKCTRLIWSLIVLGAAVVAGYFLFFTIKGFDEHYTSTTIETRSVKEFPFPAVTFHPGDFDSNTGFIRIFLNQFEFTRFEKIDSMQNNQKFDENFVWLYFPMHMELFKNIKNFLIKDGSFIRSKAKIFKDEACNLVSLEERKISVEKEIYYFYGENMYRYRGFANVLKFLKRDASQKIKEVLNHHNITKSMAKDACTNPKVKFKRVMNFNKLYLIIEQSIKDRNGGHTTLLPLPFY